MVCNLLGYFLMGLIGGVYVLLLLGILIHGLCIVCQWRLKATENCILNRLFFVLRTVKSMFFLKVFPHDCSSEVFCTWYEFNACL